MEADPAAELSGVVDVGADDAVGWLVTFSVVVTVVVTLVVVVSEPAAGGPATELVLVLEEFD